MNDKPSPPENPPPSRNRLYEVTLDEASLPRLATDQDHERAVAIFDLVEENSFGAIGREIFHLALLRRGQVEARESGHASFFGIVARGGRAACFVPGENGG